MERIKKIKYISYLKEWKVEDDNRKEIMTNTEDPKPGRVLSSASGASTSVRPEGEMSEESENIVSGQTENDLLSDKIKNEAGTHNYHAPKNGLEISMSGLKFPPTHHPWQSVFDCMTLTGFKRLLEAKISQPKFFKVKCFCGQRTFCFTENKI